MLSVKQGDIKYHFLSLWYDLTCDWILVSWAIDKHSTPPAQIIDTISPHNATALNLYKVCNKIFWERHHRWFFLVGRLISFMVYQLLYGYLMAKSALLFLFFQSTFGI